MNYKLIGATAVRVLAQLRRDPRSIAMILVLPALLLTAVYFLFENEKLPPGAPRSFDRIGLIMLAVFPFVVMFLVTSITMLRERTSGTLERLMTTPIHKADLVLGYAVAFSVMAALQSVVATGIAYWCFGLNVAGSAGLVVLLAVLNAILGVSLGLLCSAFARTEFQAVQFMPLVVIPQLLLCGLFVARDQMNEVLQGLARVMPLSYSVEALGEVARHSSMTDLLWADLLILAAIVVAMLLLSSLTLQRKRS
ncbi:ABC-2 type transport system permease protein [Psychromicrobium silvestre]|uniref:Transport permease protein n=1 Tax=Psychromicrobium silvestre TaxID=1645614 RepID=A0A7Y9S966_9MICC|nr:ABC transporter permease [Psychromicrobium silvestre]NYE96696.1 ABC-2 type transport system permease protein [Psychromicrobium silvestre]